MSNVASELVHGVQGDALTPLAADVVCHTLADTSPMGDTQGSSQLSPAEMRGKILDLESAMKQMPPAKDGQIGQIELPTFHHFAPGIYMREMRIPKGATVVGMIHKTEHLNILSRGKLRLATEQGVRDVEASMVVLSTPGVKRAATALEDSVWITVHANPTDEKDTEKLKERLVVATYAELEEFQRKQIEEMGVCPSQP